MTKKTLSLSLLLLLLLSHFIGKTNVPSADLSTDLNNKEIRSLAHQQFKSNLLELYKQCGLDGKLSFDAFRAALTGYLNLGYQDDLKNKSIVSIVDFTLPSTKKRLFVIDLAARKLLFNTYTSHGKNSGENIAVNFSNRPESHQSSMGFYVTAETYHGKHGYSLRLEGKDASFNDNARSRAIVVHGAAYVSENFIKQYGRLGRSQGCPALPQELSKEIIDVIKDGSLLFLYHNSEQYLTKSKHLNIETALMNLALLSAISGAAQI